jgi:hypothetical protein
MATAIVNESTIAPRTAGTSAIVDVLQILGVGFGEVGQNHVGAGSADRD